MKLHEDEIRIPAPDGEIRTVVISPVVSVPAGAGPRPGVLLYTDIFQITESTLRTARRLASYGVAVFVPEIYPHGELAGVALEFDDAGSLAQVGSIQGRMMIVFGSQDPHVPAAARLQVVSALYAGGEHAFMRDIGARHDPVLTDLALAQAVSFFTGR